jgi:hypothetical protein
LLLLWAVVEYYRKGRNTVTYFNFWGRWINGLEGAPSSNSECYTTLILLITCCLSVRLLALDPPITGNPEVWEHRSKRPAALTWLVCSQYWSLDLFLIRGSNSLYTMCSPMVVKMDRPNPMHSSTKSPEKCLMPICKVCDKRRKSVLISFFFFFFFYFSRILGLNLFASCLLGKCSLTWAISLALFIFFYPLTYASAQLWWQVCATTHNFIGWYGVLTFCLGWP